MKAIVINEFGGPVTLVVKEVPKPTPTSDEILIKVRAFGINRAEIYMRQGLWGDVAKISGIECVGEVDQDPSGTLKKGQCVAAIMGGMGRIINGSYAEFTCVRSANVFVLKSGMKWTELAAIPESYATAWSCLHENMKLKNEDIVFIRGGTSALGQAAINIAANTQDVVVLASTRNKRKVALLKSLGVNKIFIDNGNLSEQVRKFYPVGIDSVLDLVGNTTLIDSLKMGKKGSRICNTGFLGGGDAIAFNPLVDMPPGVDLNFFASFMFGEKDFPLSNIPMQTIVERVECGTYKAKPAQFFGFSEVPKAHELLESNDVNGKIVITL